MKKSYILERNWKIVIFAIITLGIILRAYLAIRNPFWLDEALVFFQARNNSLLDLLFIRHYDASHPPFFLLFAHFWQRIDTHPFFLRLPNLILSLVAIYLFYLIGTSVKDRLFGVLASLFYAVSNFHVNLDWQFRMYTLEIVFILFSILLLLKLLNTGDRKFLIAFAIVNFLVLFNDYSGIWYVLSLWILFFLLWFKKAYRLYTKRLFKALSASLLLQALYLPIFIANLEKGFIQVKHIGNVTLGKALGTVAEFIALDSPPKIAWFTVVLSVVGMLMFVYKKDRIQVIFRLLGLLLFFVPLSLSFVISQYSPIFNSRNLLVVSFVIIFGLASLFWFLMRRGFAFLVLPLLALFFVSLFYYLNNMVISQFADFRGVRNYILRNSAPGEEIEVLLIGPDYEVTPLKFYLDGYDNAQVLPKYKLLYFGDEKEYEIVQPELTRLGEELWLVSYWENHCCWQPGNLTKQNMENLLGCQKEIFRFTKKEFNGVYVHKCLREI